MPKRCRLGWVILQKYQFFADSAILHVNFGHFNFKMADSNRLQNLRLVSNFIFHVNILKFDEIKVPKKCRLGWVILPNFCRGCI